MSQMRPAVRGAARPLRVALVNDYQLVVEGLRAVLEPFADRVEVVEMTTNEAPSCDVDLALYDTFAAQTGQPIDLNGLLHRVNVDKVAVYSFSSDAAVIDGLFAAGVAGFISKALPGQELVDALERVAAGERVIARSNAAEPVVEEWPGADADLSIREGEILALITQGLSNQEIAARCYLSINTIKTYIRTAYRKIGVTSRSQAVAWGMMHGMRPDYPRDLRSGA